MSAAEDERLRGLAREACWRLNGPGRLKDHPAKCSSCDALEAALRAAIEPYRKQRDEALMYLRSQLHANGRSMMEPDEWSEHVRALLANIAAEEAGGDSNDK